jgi:hypothetical protein
MGKTASEQAFQGSMVTLKRLGGDAGRDGYPGRKVAWPARMRASAGVTPGRSDCRTITA